MSETTQPAAPPMGVHGGIDFGELHRVAQQVVSDAAKVEATPSWRVVSGHAACRILDEHGGTVAVACDPSRAHMLAAAPELMVSIARMVVMLEQGHTRVADGCPYCDWLAEARAILAKATEVSP